MPGRLKGRLSRMLGEDPATLNWDLLEEYSVELKTAKAEYNKIYIQVSDLETNPTAINQDNEDADKWEDSLVEARATCKLLMSTKQVHGLTRALKTAVSGLNRAVDSEPSKGHEETVAEVVSLTTKLKAELLSSALDEGHRLRAGADTMLEESAVVLAKPSKAVKTEAGTHHSSGAENPYKLVNVPVPRFSGRIEDWVSFWAKFQQQVANRRGLDDQGKLAYLLQGIDDKELKESVEKEAHKDGAYSLIVAELHSRFDQPRTIHRKYCDDLKNLTKNNDSRTGMIRFADNLSNILNGFVRLKAEDCRQFITTMAEPHLSKTLRDGWNLHTEKRKDIPPVEELIAYIKMKSAQAPEEVTPTSSKQPAEKNKGKPQQPKYRGSTNTVAAPPVPTPSSNPPYKRKGASYSQRAPYPQCKYVCPLCADNHYAWFCSQFEQLSITQRKEHARQHNLCNNCLKPGHLAVECRSTYKCKTCQGSHNSLLHEPSAAAPQASTNTTSSSSSPQLKENLMMTSQVRLTGPTGMTVIVRALLDSASSLSIISSHATRMLALSRRGGSVCIQGVGSATHTSSSPLSTVTLSPVHNTGWQREITVAVLNKVTRDLPMQGASSVRSLSHIKELKLADNQFDSPGTIDILLGQDIWQELFLPGEASGPPGTPMAWLTVFGWVIMGNYSIDGSPSSKPASSHAITASPAQVSDKLMVKFWEVEEPPLPKLLLTPEEKKVEDHYDATHQFVQSASRYMVCLPRRKDAAPLGESRTQALNRARANERSLLHKGTWPKFQEVIQEYLSLGHATPVSKDDLDRPASLSYYMPMHGVYKESSTTTKLRVVFDASAKTASHHSFNESLAIGPTLHPTLDRILLKFRSYPVAISGDISKMYREVLLHPEDRHYHRFIWRAEIDQPWQEYQMSRVTFGVAASPYLAVKTLQQAAKDFAGDLPQAGWHIEHSFYVDDLLGGADTVEEAIVLQGDLRSVLGQAGFGLRKWRSSSPQVLASIPTELLEPMPTQDLVDLHSASYPKALGMAWNSKEDTMATHVELPATYCSSKRGIISDIARTFDVLGWVAPAILPMKLLYRQMWKEKKGWDVEASEDVKQKHQAWREELPILSTVHLDRCYFAQEKPLTVDLHGFCDASADAYGAVVYIRTTYANQPPACELVMAKTRVAPLKPLTIPRLELCGATLLAKLMKTAKKTLSISTEHVHGWSDSTIVLSWLDGSPERLRIYAANRLVTIMDIIPPEAWKHVPTEDNPADCASRGVTPEQLKSHRLWWHGPPWLQKEPVLVPKQPNAVHTEDLEDNELKPQISHIISATPTDWLEAKYGSYMKLLVTLSWIRRFISNIRLKSKGRPILLQDYVTVEELKASKLVLQRRSQHRSFPLELHDLTSKTPKPIAPKSYLLSLQPRLDKDGLLKVGGRLGNASLSEEVKHPIILKGKDILCKLIFREHHLLLGHCGPTLLLAHLGPLYHVVGARGLAKNVCRSCVACRKSAAKIEHQLMGQLPSSRITANFVFFNTGVDFAGPYYIKYSYTRKPVIVKSYLAVFVCFCTKAVHLEVVGDLTTEAFLASVKRFTSRRGLPKHFHSDNATNFVGAKNELKDIYQLLSQRETQNAVQDYLLSHEVQWHNIPQRAPHFGGLWEAAVKSAKHHLRRIIGNHHLTFEELMTIACQVEAYLNSRPLGVVFTHAEDGVVPLTPGHWLVGRPLLAFPELQTAGNPIPSQRWSYCQGMTDRFWRRWSTEYLQQLQRAIKWTKKNTNFKPGDMVMMTDGKVFKAQWTMARVTSVYPGRDGVVRAVDVQVVKAVIPKKYASKTELAQLIKARAAVYRRPVHKLIRLLPEEEVPGVLPEGLPWPLADAAGELSELPDDVAEEPDQTIP